MSNPKRTSRRGNTYDFIVSSTRVVSPCAPLHDLLRHRLEVHQVVALRYQGFVLDALLPVDLLGIFRLLDLSHGAQINGPKMFRLVEVLVKGIRRVNRVEGFRRIFALRRQTGFSIPANLGTARKIDIEESPKKKEGCTIGAGGEEAYRVLEDDLHPSRVFW